jgi:Transglycosylase
VLSFVYENVGFNSTESKKVSQHMKIFRRIFIIAAYAFTTLFLLAFYFVFFDAHGLPESDWLYKFSPNVNSLILNPSTGAPINIIPYSSINHNLAQTFSLAVTGEDAPHLLSPTLISIFVARPKPTTSYLIARTFDYNQGNLFRGISEIRLAIQLDYRFSPSQRFTILLNRTHFSPTTTGIADASQLLFHCAPEELTFAQAATLAALANRPSLVSEPDSLRDARNKILSQLLPPAEAEKAANSSLGFK